MTTCRDVLAFLNAVRGRSVSAPIATEEAARLEQLGIVRFLTADQYRQLQSDVASLATRQAAIAQEGSQEQALAAEAGREAQRTHSVLFHLQGATKQQAEVQAAAQSRAEAAAMQADLAQKEKEFSAIVAQRSLLDTLGPYGDRYVALTGFGQLQLRDLALRMYRAADMEFGAYWDQTQRIASDLNNLAASGASYAAGLITGLPSVNRAYLWAASLDLSKRQPDPTVGGPQFLQIFHAVRDLSSNDENRLMTSEVLFALGGALPQQLPVLTGLVKEVRHQNVPSESALGVASILLFGRRADGSFATANLAECLRYTRSYESAALLAIMNTPLPALEAKFASLRTLFGSWGYTESEDLELSSAFLAVSELPVEGIATKLAIIARGLNTYLQYPLVAAAILASVSTLEANETLNLLEEAYEIVGRRAMPMSQPELICLAVRMIHGIRNELAGELDATAAAPPPGAAARYMGGPRFLFVPVVVMHGAYYSTFSGVGGAHPAHAHGWAGGGFVG